MENFESKPKVPKSVEFAPGEEPSEFKFTAKEIEELKAKGLTDQQIEDQRRSIDEKILGGAFLKKVEESQK